MTYDVPQGSVLGFIFSSIYINDLDTGAMNQILTFVDDTKTFGKVNTVSDGLKQQERPTKAYQVVR